MAPVPLYGGKPFIPTHGGEGEPTRDWISRTYSEPGGLSPVAKRATRQNKFRLEALVSTPSWRASWGAQATGPGGLAIRVEKISINPASHTGAMPLKFIDAKNDE